MLATERTALLPRDVEGLPPAPLSPRFSAPNGEPSWGQSYKWFFFGSWMNSLLVFVPLSAIAHYSRWDVAYRFAFSSIAITRLAKLLGHSTERISSNLGQTPTRLLITSFGNSVQIIVGATALSRGEIRLVQTSLLGSILSKILLVVGCSFLAAGFKFPESEFQTTAARVSSSLMTLACIILAIPTAFYSSLPHHGPVEGLLTISRGTALVLLFIYCAYLWFQLKTHAHLYSPDRNEEQEGPKMNIVSASTSLLCIAIVTPFCADYLVSSIGEFAQRYHVPKPFIGLILLPIIANAAENATSVWTATRKQVELTITTCAASSIRIATFVVPLMVIVGWTTGNELTLFFGNFETVVLFASVLLVNGLLHNGKSNYMEGLMLVSLYFVVSHAFWVA